MLRSFLGSVCWLVLSSMTWADTTLDQLGTDNVPKKSTVPEGGVEVPMQIRDGVPAIEVMLNGQGPFVLLVDTCGMGTVHPDERVSKKLELPVVGEVQASDGSGGATRQLELINVDRLQIGDAVFEGMVGPTRDYGAEGPRQPVDGALGIHTFAECLVTFDFPNQKFRIERGELPPADGKEVLALDDSVYLPTIEWKLAGDESVPTHVDTGNMGGLAVSPKVAERMKFAGELQTIGEARTITSRSAVKQGRLAESLLLGKHEFQRPQVSVMEFIPDANLGSEMLKNFALTVDLRNARLRLARAGNEPIVMAPRYVVGVMFRPDRGAFIVDNVLAGGAGEAAGLKKGDVIVEIGGVSAAELDTTALRAALGQPNPVEIKFDRDGKEQVVTVTPRKVD